MRIEKLFEDVDDDIFDEMTLGDSLLLLAELADNEELSEDDLDIIEAMFDELDGDDELDEAQTLVQHGDKENERTATFTKAKASDRIKNRIKQRIYRRRGDVKLKAKKKAARQKTCGKNQTAQLTKKGGTSYSCRIKNRFKSKLMKRVKRMYK